MTRQPPAAYDSPNLATGDRREAFRPHIQHGAVPRPARGSPHVHHGRRAAPRQKTTSLSGAAAIMLAASGTSAASSIALRSASFLWISAFFLSCERLRRKNSSRSSSSSSDLMYATVFAMRGMTTVSSALTRRLVTLIASSRMTKDVCSVASWTSTSTDLLKVVRAFAICWPPLERPVWSKLTASALSTALNTGTFTPAMLSIRVSTRFCAELTFSMTMGLMSPAAYFTSDSAKLPSLKAVPIASLASRMERSRLRSRMVSASAFFFRRE
mmetsp:Transcript_19802/g.45621  ORF Transcript_19802/g.45621 Transcript_19802/m.45621 type:complete len:270 (-) Transcript_19802:136-945(-)